MNVEKKCKQQWTMKNTGRAVILASDTMLVWNNGTEEFPRMMPAGLRVMHKVQFSAQGMPTLRWSYRKRMRHYKQKGTEAQVKDGLHTGSFTVQSKSYIEKYAKPLYCFYKVLGINFFPSSNSIHPQNICSLLCMGWITFSLYLGLLRQNHECNCRNISQSKTPHDIHTNQPSSSSLSFIVMPWSPLPSDTETVASSTVRRLWMVSYVLLFRVPSSTPCNLKSR